MIPASSVSNFDMFTDITSLAINASTFDFTASTRTTYTSESLVDLLGERVPSVDDSQKAFKLLVIVITDSPLSDDEGNRVDASVFNAWKKRVPGSQGDYAVMARIAQRVAGKKNGKAKASS